MGQIKIGNQIVTPAIVDTTVGSLNVTPTTSTQIITPSAGVDGFNPVNVSAVTSAIDSNITAGNIRKDVTILGVTGTLGGNDFVILDREVSNNGVYQMPTTSFTFSLPSNVTDVGYAVMQYAFYGCTGLTSVDLSSLITLSGGYAMQYAFYGCTGLTSLDLSSLTTISGNYAMYESFNNCTGLTSVDLSSLTTLSGSNAMNSVFYNCTGLTSVDLSSLTTVSGNGAMQYAFQSCTSLTSLSFPALTSTSFGSGTNQFNNMLRRTTGCTVHFPSNLQSVIGSWSDVTAGFGGTNTTVLFDLLATT